MTAAVLPPSHLLRTDPLPFDVRDKDTPDEWVNRDPALVRLTGAHPFNAEPEVPDLYAAGDITPPELHFVRNHGPVPKIQWGEWKVVVDGLHIPTATTFTMTEILSLPSIRVPVTLTCCGNRRQEQNMTKKSAGFKWGPGAISTSVWTGVPIREVLKRAGMDIQPEDYGRYWVQTEGGDTLPKGIYGTCIQLSRIMDLSSDMMLAYAMNDKALPPDHGFPLRVMLPGYIGGRMVKWLNKITIVDTESSHVYHLTDNRVLPPPPIGPSSVEEAVAKGWWNKPEYVVNERNVNSVIAFPQHEETIDVMDLLSKPVPKTTYTLKGYAYTGGGRRVTHCQISLNGGEDWIVTDKTTYDFEPRHGDKYWCWFKWEHTFTLKELMLAKEVVIRAWDSAMNTQPEKLCWNLLGMLNNCWYRVKVEVSSDFTITFIHPTNVTGKGRPGWMPPPGEEGVVATPGVPAAAPKPAHPVPEKYFSLSEVKKHNTKKSCWFILHGVVIDATKYLKLHPGGEKSILIVGGKDATEDFDAIHSKTAKALADKYAIGYVDLTGDKTKDQAPAPLPAPTPIPATPLRLRESTPAPTDDSKSDVAPSDLEELKSLADTSRSHSPPYEVTSPTTPLSSLPKKRIIVIGLGMVGLRFCEKLLALDTRKEFSLTVFGEEKYHAYNRVGLTKYFEHRTPASLLMAEADWYHRNDVDLHLNDMVVEINTTAQTVTSQSGVTIPYDKLVFATGSKAFVPPIQGKEKPGVFVYRTIDDLDAIIAYAQTCERKKAVVVGGGLLGLEAAKACLDLGLETKVLERSQWLMRRQLDHQAGSMLADQMSKMGIETLVGSDTREICGEGRVGEVIVNRNVEGRGRWTDTIDTDLVVLSCGIVPRDEVAKSAGIETGKRGGIIVNDYLETSTPNIYAIGECVLHNGQVFGLVQPGYEMASLLAKNLTAKADAERHAFTWSDMSAKLKLFGVQVGSFGDYFADEGETRHISYVDPIGQMYKRFILSKDGKRLVGGILFGDTSDFTKLVTLAKSSAELRASPLDILAGKFTSRSSTSSSSDDDESDVEFEDTDQICACNDVTKGVIVSAVREQGCRDVEGVKKCTKAAWEEERATWESEKAKWDAEKAVWENEKVRWEYEKQTWESEKAMWALEKEGWELEKRRWDSEKAVWELEKAGWEEREGVGKEN
ncbi:hypothetical protein HDV00_011625 [Rhizophlyctis rosea]|nr:hypothetical protein HDV00_011625 [Rhizophlyctis rosea]